MKNNNKQRNILNDSYMCNIIYPEQVLNVEIAFNTIVMQWIR